MRSPFFEYHGSQDRADKEGAGYEEKSYQYENTATVLTLTLKLLVDNC